jgi:DNA polymerase V
MGVLDEINARWGRGTLRVASVPANPDWGMRREMKSPSFTNRMDELWTVYCK